MNFKDYFMEGKDPYVEFSVNVGKDRWSFTNLETNKRYFIKKKQSNIYDSMGYFLRDIDATASADGAMIDHFTFASNLIKGEKNKIYVKSSNFDKIAKKWILD